MVVAAAATSVWSLCGSAAFADADASGQATDSSGVLAGNNVQAPVHVPLNACGNTANIAALLNPAFGTSCGNDSDSGTSASSSGAVAESATEGSSGVLAGNTVQVPIHAPLNACGNTADVIGALNPAGGGDCAIGSGSGTSASSSGGASASSSTAGSSGVLAGNTVQVPIHAPLNACGNTVDVVSVLNPVADITCVNGSGSDTSASSTGGASASSSTEGSSGVLSGNIVQVPVHVPLHLCGNTANVVGALNPVSDAGCAADSSTSTSVPPVNPPAVTPPAVTPPAVTPPAVTPPAVTPPATETTPGGTTPRDIRPAGEVEEEAQLAETGAGETAAAAVAGAALLLGGALLYRRGRVAAGR